MTRRTALPATGETSVTRLARRAEEDRQEARAGFSAILDSIETLRTEVRRGAQDNGRLEQRFKDLELQVNMTRDEIQRRAINPAPSQIASAKQAIKETAKSPLGIAATLAALVCSIIIIANNIPDAQRVIEKLWSVTREMDQPPAQ